MKKTRLVLSIIIILTITGCGRQDLSKEATIEEIVADFYDGSYEYKKTETYYDGEEESSVIIREGKITHSPYKEYIKITEASSGSLWNEAYFYGSGKTVNALILTNQGWQETKLKLEHPYGYGEELSFMYDREEEIEGSINEVYIAEYSINVGNNYGIQEDLTAVIKQEYFLDKENKVLTQITTDLTDCNQKTCMANDIAVNGVTLEDAKRNMKSQSNLTEIEKLEIFNYGKEIAIDIPSDT